MLQGQDYSSKISLITSLSQQLKYGWMQHGLNKNEIDQKLMKMVMSCLPSNKQSTTKSKFSEVLSDTMRNKKEASHLLSKILMRLDLEVSQMKINEEEEESRNVIKKKSNQKIDKRLQQSSKKVESLRPNFRPSPFERISAEFEQEEDIEDHFEHLEVGEENDSHSEQDMPSFNFEQSIKLTIERTKILRSFLQEQLKGQFLKSKPNRTFTRLRTDFLSTC